MRRDTQGLHRSLAASGKSLNIRLLDDSSEHAFLGSHLNAEDVTEAAEYGGDCSGVNENVP
jgi:hypothetical protein